MKLDSPSGLDLERDIVCRGQGAVIRVGDDKMEYAGWDIHDKSARFIQLSRRNRNRSLWMAGTHDDACRRRHAFVATFHNNMA